MRRPLGPGHLGVPAGLRAGLGRVGDDSVDLRLTVPFTTAGREFEATSDVVFARVGRGLVVVTVVSSPISSFDRTDEKGYLELAGDRLAVALRPVVEPSASVQ